MPKEESKQEGSKAQAPKELANDSSKNVPRFEFIDNPHAPEYFVSTISGARFDFSGSNLTLTFESHRDNHESDADRRAINRVVNLRVVMSVQSAAQLTGFLQDTLTKAALNQAQKPPEQPLQ